ncbi:MAG: hypothetical protein MI864_04535 [Pseudomonadales bacterium]|nr:hypothetical protein [Pseudomonadales bacterium]
MFKRIILSILFSGFLLQGISTASANTSKSLKYPIILVCGAFCFDSVLGYDYWYGIRSRLIKEGADVYVVNLSSLSDNFTRGEELVDDIQKVLAIADAPKANLIAHSQGALASRYAAYIIPGQVASITSVHGLNKGLHYASGLLAAVPGENDVLENILSFFPNWAFNFLEIISTPSRDGEFNSETRTLNQSFVTMGHATTPEAVAEFNQQYPAGLPKQDCMAINNGTTGEVAANHYGDHVVTLYDDNGPHTIRFYSWGGNEETTTNTELFDLFSRYFVKYFVQWSVADPDIYEWDGFMPTCGHALGKVIRLDYTATHFDAINQIAGIPWFNGVSIPAIYASHVSRLRADNL